MYDKTTTGGVVLGTAATTGAAATLANTGTTQIIASVLVGLFVMLFAALVSGNITRLFLSRKK